MAMVPAMSAFVKEVRTIEISFARLRGSRVAPKAVRQASDRIRNQRRKANFRNFDNDPITALQRNDEIQRISVV
jgi:hypothetical protein